MLIEFTVGNYRSIKEKKTLSLEAAPITDFPHNVFKQGKYDILRSAVIYGANSSGKSNLIKALTFMQSFVNKSAKNSSTDKIDTIPFMLNTESASEPSYFEVLFLIENVRYRYGFETTIENITAEWLFRCNDIGEELLFIRNNDEIEVSEHFEEAVGLETRTRDNALFISVVDQFNGETAKKIMEWFGGHAMLSGLQHERDRHLTILLLNSDHFKKEMREFIQQFNLGFNDLLLLEDKADSFTSPIFTVHNKYDRYGEIQGTHQFNLSNDESSGTNKLIDLAGNILIGLKLGRLTVIDELDAKLHPLLSLAIVKLFNTPEKNPFNAQLIFATHDTNLLSHGNLRRDQIYFTEKNRFEETDLYSLVEYKENGIKVRKDRKYEKDYIQGRYGAIPFIGDFNPS